MSIVREQEAGTYLRGYDARISAGELRDFVSSNSGLKTLVTSLTQRYRDTLTKLDVNSFGDLPDFIGRLLLLQGIIDSGLSNAFVVETAVRKLDTGIAVPFAIPDSRPVNIKELRRGNCTTSVVRIDAVRVEEFPSGLSAHTALARTGWLFVTAIGKVSLDKRGRVEDEELDGVSLFIGDDSSCYGLAAGFRGQRFISLGKKVYFNEHLLRNVADVVEGAKNLSFVKAF